LAKIQQPLVAKSVGLQKQQAMAAKSSIEEQPSLLEKFFSKKLLTKYSKYAIFSI
jgi:hypothetical protein